MTSCIENFLPQEIAEDLHDYVRRIKWSYGWRSNSGMGYAHWNHDIAKAGTANGLDVESRISGAVADAWNFIKATYLKDHILIRCYANSHTYGVEGYPHTDSRRDQDTTVVIYMNKDWRREWGGETLVYDGSNIESATVPQFNRAVIFNGNKWHCARGVTRICPDQRKTIMFKAAKRNADPYRDALQQLLNKHGAPRFNHKNGSLQNHLLITYDLLKEAGQPTAVCLAGGAHSIFGTNAFRHVCIDPTEFRAEVSSVIGEAATQLVELFSKIDRPRTLVENMGNETPMLRTNDGGAVPVTKMQFDALLMIECANLSEQNELGRTKRLQEHWRARKRNDLSVHGDKQQEGN